MLKRQKKRTHCRWYKFRACHTQPSWRTSPGRAWRSRALAWITGFSQSYRYSGMSVYVAPSATCCLVLATHFILPTWLRKSCKFSQRRPQFTSLRPLNGQTAPKLTWRLTVRFSQNINNLRYKWITRSPSFDLQLNRPWFLGMAVCMRSVLWGQQQSPADCLNNTFSCMWSPFRGLSESALCKSRTFEYRFRLWVCVQPATQCDSLCKRIKDWWRQNKETKSAKESICQSMTQNYKITHKPVACDTTWNMAVTRIHKHGTYTFAHLVWDKQKAYGYLHSSHIACVCKYAHLPATTQSDRDRVCVSAFSQDCLCSWSFERECLYVKQWTAARPHYCHSPHCLKERQREAKRSLSIQELKKGGDKGPKLNKCWKAAWRASPWSCALNKRERLWDNPSGSFSGETTQIHSIPGIRLNYRSTHTGVPICLSPASV